MHSPTPTPPDPPTRLPSYLLSGTPPPTPHPPHPPTPHAISFNDRLRPQDFTPPPPLHRTSPRLPPTKSLFDVGVTSVVSLRTPSATPPPTPVSSPCDRWITVFGYPSALETSVQKEMRRHGDVVRFVPGRGNWMHVLFRTQLQASVALHKPWRVLQGTNCMVGVVACTEPNVVCEIDSKVEKGVIMASPGGLRTPKSLIKEGGGVRTPQRETGVWEYLGSFVK